MFNLNKVSFINIFQLNFSQKFNLINTNFSYTGLLSLVILLAVSLFIAGVALIAFNTSNLIITLIGIELILMASNINFLSHALVTNEGLGFVYSLCVLTISAAETAIGAGILIVCYSIKQTVDFKSLNSLKD